METLQPVTEELARPTPASGEGKEGDEPGAGEAGTEQRVLMLARVGQDEALAERALSKAGYELVVGRDGERLAAEIDAGAGALIVTAEALTPEHLGHLLDALERQPPWSDLPVLALPQEESASARWTAQAMERLGNVIVLERPLKNASLVSSVKSALRDRSRQYRFRDMLSRLDEVERQRHQFLVDLGHEVRNPLAVIRTSLSLLGELGGEGDDKRRRQPIELIERQTEQLSRLIDDLLQVTRFNVGRLALRRTATDLAEVVESTLDNFSLLAKAGGGSLDLEIDEGEVPVSADPVSLEQMIFHLVRGAIRDTRPGERASLAVRAEENHAVLTVTAGDGSDGAGGGEGNGGGEGGLAQSMPIVRNLAELHGGQVEIRHEGGRREVEVRLPRRAEGGKKRRPRKRRKGESLSVLVVEDSPDGREGLTTLLELKSFKVTSAGSGKEALAKVDKAKPEVALVDIGLPDMDGYEVARELRRRFDSQLTLIALTGYGQPDDRRKALEAGFDLHLVKPVDPQQLFDLLGDIAAGPEG
jgi:CheY-like chemotaxis protein/signal transduction histidine kinase